MVELSIFILLFLLLSNRLPAPVVVKVAVFGFGDEVGEREGY